MCMIHDLLQTDPPGIPGAGLGLPVQLWGGYR